MLENYCYTPLVQFSEMSYVNLPTPSTTSEASQSPVYQVMPLNGLTNSPNFIIDDLQSLHFNGHSPMSDHYQGYIEILEQPVEKFRFRYKSEMSGTHGSLTGASTEKNRKATFPTVKLYNYNGPAIIRCSLYTFSKDMPEDSRQPHPHRLVLKHDTEELVDPHDKEVDVKRDMTVVFKGMGIIHTAKKHIQDELKSKKTKLLQEEIHRLEQKFRKLTTREEADIKQKIQDEEKNINLNVVCLRFDAFYKHIDGALIPICEPVYSNPIYNLKSAMTGDLKISRMDHCTSPASGFKDVFLLVEKVAKKNIKVQFFELDGQDEEKVIWRADAKFHENDVHHQYAIVIKTPAYRNPALDKPTTNVYVQLLRPSDGETSEPRPFTYLPDRSGKRKRLHQDYEYSSSSSIEMPDVIRNMQSPQEISEELQKCGQNVNSEEFQKLYNEMVPLFQPTAHQIEPVESFNFSDFARDGVKSTIPFKTKEQFFKKQLHDLESYLKTGKTEVDKMIRKMFQKKLSNGNNLLQFCMIHYEDSHSKMLKDTVLPLIKRLKLYDLLNAQNQDGETVVHIAIKNGAQVDQLADLPLEQMQVDMKTMVSPLHLAVEYNYGIETLCTRLKGILIEQPNSDGLTALQCAVKANNLWAVKELIKNGAIVNVQDNHNGNNILHQAIYDENLALIEYLATCTSIKKSHENYEEKTCLALAMERLSGENLRRVCKLLDPDMDYDIFESALVKDEKDDSESDEDEVEDVEVKEESIDDDESTDNLLDDVPLDFIKDLEKMEFSESTLSALYEDLSFGYMLGVNTCKSRSIAFLIHLALTNGVRLTEVKRVMEQRKLMEAAKCIDRALAKKQFVLLKYIC